jgi:uncharacterized protein YjbI with pentapeptide repeats
MANQKHLDILSKGVEAWNRWREDNPTVQPDFSGATFSRVDVSDLNFNNANFSNSDFSNARFSNPFLIKTDFTNAILRGASIRYAQMGGAILSGADLSGANLTRSSLNRALLIGATLNDTTLSYGACQEADFTNAKLIGAQLGLVNLHRATLVGANLSGANLAMTNLTGANLSNANLTGAFLNNAILVKTNLEKAILTSCVIHGISAWNVTTAGANQTNLVITPHGEPTVTVDNLEVAQFIYLLLNNEKVRDIIDTITSKAVLILGRFTEDRKAVLDAIREELRSHDYLPIMFDFEQPSSRNLTETVSTLAHMSRFVIADITDAKSIPQELQRIVPDLPSLPVQPLILDSQYEYSMFKDFSDYPWVLTPYRYHNTADLLSSLEEKVIGPAVRKAKEIEERRKTLEKMT